MGPAAVKAVVGSVVGVIISFFAVSRAGKMNRSQVVWGILGFLVPISYFILLCLDPKEKSESTEESSKES